MNDIKTNTTKKTYTVFSQKLCGELVAQGFILINVSRHRQYPDKNVYHFSDSDNLRRAVELYKENNRKKNSNEQS